MRALAALLRTLRRRREMTFLASTRCCEASHVLPRRRRRPRGSIFTTVFFALRLSIARGYDEPGESDISAGPSLLIAESQGGGGVARPAAAGFPLFQLGEGEIIHTHTHVSTTEALRAAEIFQRTSLRESPTGLPTSALWTAVQSQQHPLVPFPPIRSRAFAEEWNETSSGKESWGLSTCALSTYLPLVPRCFIS